MQLGQYEINGRGGIRALGGRPLHIKAQQVPSTASGTPDALCEADLYTGGGGTLAAGAISSHANVHDKLFLATLAMRGASASPAQAPTTFHLRSDVQMLTRMLAASVRDHAVRRWSIIAADNDEGFQAADGFRSALQTDMPTAVLVGVHVYAEGDADPVRLNQEISAVSPDGIFSTLRGEDLRRYLEHPATASTLAHRTVVSLNRPEFNDPVHHWHGVRATRIVTGYDASDERGQSHRAFVQAYRNWHGCAPTYASLIGYVAVEMLAALLERIGRLEGRTLAAALEGMAFETGAGPVIMQGSSHQASFGAWVGEAHAHDAGGPSAWRFHDGLLHLPPQAWGGRNEN